MRQAHSAEGGSEADRPTSPSRWRRETGGVLVRLGVVVGVLLVAGSGVFALNHLTAPEVSPTTDEIPALSVQPASVEPGTNVPGNATVAGTAAEDDEEPAEPEQASVQETLRDWAERLGPELDVPPRALVAYGMAEISVRENLPGCELSWATLAGIGRVESFHGQYGDAVLQDDGLPSEPIIGIALDGSDDVKRIQDTDGGKWDGDQQYDRAVGPMQFIPGTWSRFAADGNGNGESHPQQIDDAALAAAHYLCRGGRDMSSGQGWWQGVLSYNDSVEYGQRVFAVADSYASTAQSLG